MKLKVLNLLKETENTYGVNSDLTNFKIQEQLKETGNSEQTENETNDEDLSDDAVDDEDVESIVFSSESLFFYFLHIFLLLA